MNLVIIISVVFTLPLFFLMIFIDSSVIYSQQFSLEVYAVLKLFIAEVKVGRNNWLHAQSDSAV